MTDLAAIGFGPNRAEQGNTTVAAPVSRVHSLASLMAAYDTLPARLRGALSAASCNWSPVSVLENFRDWTRLYGAGPAMEAMIRVIARNEVAELDAFDRVYRAQLGHPLPHLAAGATPQRPQWGAMRRPVRGEPRPGRLFGPRRRA